MVQASTAAWGTQVSFLGREIAARATALAGGLEIASVRVSVDPDRTRRTGPR